MYYSTLQIFYLIKRSWICIFVGPIAQLVRATNCELDRDVSPQAYTLQKQYEILKNWEKVAQHFGLTRRVIQGIRKKDS